MTSEKNDRRLLLALLVVGTLCLLTCCGGLGYFGYRSLNTIAEAYEPAKVPAVGGIDVNLDVRPQKRIEDGFGGRLVGPPYELAFILQDASDRLARARLHSVRIVPGNGGNAIPVPVTNGDNPAGDSGLIMLYARIERESLGSRPQLVADVEVFTTAGSVREELTFALRRRSRASLNMP